MYIIIIIIQIFFAYIQLMKSEHKRMQIGDQKFINY